MTSIHGQIRHRDAFPDAGQGGMELHVGLALVDTCYRQAMLAVADGGVPYPMGRVGV